MVASMSESTESQPSEPADPSTEVNVNGTGDTEVNVQPDAPAESTESAPASDGENKSE